MTGKKKSLFGEGVCGPYLNERGRMAVWLYNSTDSSFRTINLSRYLMEQKLGRRLATTEDVHHVNGDFTDDRIENLEILSRKEHRATYNQRMLVVLTCPICGKEFSRRIGRVHENEKRGGKNYCSKDCGHRGRGKF